MLIAVVIIFQSITDLIIKLTKRYYLSIRDIDLVKKIKKKNLKTLYRKTMSPFSLLYKLLASISW